MSGNSDRRDHRGQSDRDRPTQRKDQGQQPPPQRQGGQRPTQPQHQEQGKQRRGQPRDRGQQPPPQQQGGQRREQARRDSGGTSRRNLLLGGAGLAAILGGGWFFLVRDDGNGPSKAAEEFVAALDEGEFSRADELIHPQSPLDGAGDAANALVAVAGIGRAIDAVDVSVTQTEILQRGDGQAVVEATIAVDLLVESIEADVPLDMRTADGDWYVWNLSL
jgi:hypothetical protein